MSEATQKVFGTRPDTLAADEASLVDARGFAKLTIITGAGATVTWSRVDALDADEHVGAGTEVAADTTSTVEVDWPFYYVSVAGGSARIALA